jgi:hypothetical protein
MFKWLSMLIFPPAALIECEFCKEKILFCKCED